LLAPREPQSNTPAGQEQFSELLRLRGEVGRLRSQEREAEQARQREMLAAKAKVPEAEAQLARLKKLYSQKVVSEQEFNQFQLEVALLKAAANGDQAEAARIRLQQAEAELARAARLRSQSLISQTEYDEALRKAESLRTTIK